MLYIAGVGASDKQTMLEQFSFAAGSLPVMTKQMTVITILLSSRKSGLVSVHVMRDSISSVIHTLTSFWISAFLLPKKCIRDIDSLFSAFLSSGPELSTKMAKVAWKDCCKPKEEGGLGLISLAEANTVSSLKLVWKILSSKTSLWVQWVNRFLIRKNSCWSVKESSTLVSWSWKSRYT